MANKIFILLFIILMGGGVVAQKAVSSIEWLRLDDLRMFTTPMNELLAASNNHQISQLYDSTCFRVIFRDSTLQIKETLLIRYHIRKEVAYWPNGDLRFERYYYNRKPFGKWKYWDTGNHLKYFIEYLNETHLRVQIYYPNGGLRSERNYVTNKDKFTEHNYALQGYLMSSGERIALLHKGGKSTAEQGEWQFYYASGQLKEKGKFDQGKKVGKWKYFDTSGRMVRLIWFKDGKTVKQQSLGQVE